MSAFLSVIHAEDGFAIAMLVISAAAMGTIGLLFWSMKRNVARRDPYVDALLEELENEEREAQRRSHSGPVTPTSQPWERDPDWWRAD
jgi:hypothetical protein